MKVRIAVPTPGQPLAVTIQRLDELVRKAGWAPVHLEIASVSAAESKSRIVKWFLQETDADKLIIVDHDVVPPMNFLDLAKHALPIVGAPYMINVQELAAIPIPGVLRLKDQSIKEGPNLYTSIERPYHARGLVECDGMVGGALCIERKVLERVKPAFLFTHDEWGLLDKTEDIYFCEKAKALGYKIYADFDLFCEHYHRLPMMATMQALLGSVKVTNPPRT